MDIHDEAGELAGAYLIVNSDPTEVVCEFEMPRYQVFMFRIYHLYGLG